MVKPRRHLDRPGIPEFRACFFGVACIALLCFIPSVGRLQAQSAGDEAPAEPTLISVFPPGGQKGSGVELKIRGEALDGAYSLVFGSSGLEARVGEVEMIEGPEPAGPYPKKGKSLRFFRVKARLTVDSSVPAGTHPFRLVSHRGVSNAIDFRVDEGGVISEIDTPHPSHRQAQEIDIPVIVNGRIDEHGELDAYGFDAVAGQELTFEITQAAHFEPRLALYRPTGSWLDPERPTRLLFREQVSTDLIPLRPIYSYRVAESGRYLVEVASLLGKGGPDCGYQLRVLTTGPAPQASSEPTWTERHFTRKIDGEWTGRLRSRTVQANPGSHPTETASGAGSLAASPDSPRSAATPAPEGRSRLREQEPNEARGQAVPFTVGDIVEGNINAPGDRDTYAFEGEAGAELVFELETFGMEPPHFNPRMELFGENGESLLANVHKHVTVYNGGGIPSTFLKTVEPKMAYTLERSGRYFLEVSDITARYGGPDFGYRLLFRAPIPHVGAIAVDPSDRINLVPGRARKLSIVTHQEEGFAGEVLFDVSNLPPGVRVFPGADVEKKGNAPVSQQEENFLPAVQTTTLVLLADPDTAVTRMPSLVRLTARPVVGGRVGADLPVAEILLMVVAPAGPDQAAEQGGS